MYTQISSFERELAKIVHRLQVWAKLEASKDISAEADVPQHSNDDK